jgi:hypothetical protein
VESINTNDSRTISISDELNSIIKQSHFRIKFKNNYILEGSIAEDIQGIYKNRLETEKKLK